MANDISLKVLIRPLSNYLLEEQLPVNISNEPGDIAMNLIGELVEDRQTPLDTTRARYRDVSDECEEPHVVPAHPTILDHVIRPLVEAKQCYVLGMPVACIAQAGLVGEMVALWRFRMLSNTVDGTPLDEGMQKALMGSTFDKLGQDARVRVLRGLEALDNDIVNAFNDLRLIRRKYLHFMVDKSENKDADARKAMKLANMLVIKTLGVQSDEGRITLPEKVARYIRDVISLDDGTSSSVQASP